MNVAGPVRAVAELEYEGRVRSLVAPRARAHRRNWLVRPPIPTIASMLKHWQELPSARDLGDASAEAIATT